MGAGRPRLRLNDLEIAERYLAGESESHLARALGVGRTTIHRRLISAHAQFRSAVEASDLRRFRVFPMTASFVELLDGFMLGDGCLEYNRVSETRIEVTQQRPTRLWLEDVATALRGHGVEVKISDRGPRGYQLRTGKYATLTQQRSRWYPGGKKRIPEDLCLTAVSVAHWYWGDGSTENFGYRMSFCTDGFTSQENQELAERMSCLLQAPVKARLRTKSSKYHRLFVETKEGRRNLVELIRPYCPACFAYKLEVR